ncbi:ABC transporter ATP-binding protein [uncultured Desulfobacter sp.]|uniref:ABC transporter ATP-binding protein n=1 Tax=uncultured Desulfobacter sp. TaxID=240139 RepID=UPI002AAB33EF|nr:ABC transporter ATP-binding protein [uncultured Desulfobacter sp.]
MTLQIDNVCWQLDDVPILNHIKFNVEKQEMIGLIGPNGSGKSSLLRTIYRVVRPTAGFIRYNGRDIWQLSLKECAKQISVVLQERSHEFDLTVYDVVITGRTPHKSALGSISKTDEDIVMDALKKVKLEPLKERSIQTLSGGEMQRVLIARSLAQKACLLLLDEPTNHLDIRYQLEVLSLVRKLNVPVIAALHDLNLAAMFCDRIILMNQGKIAADGPPESVITKDRIKEVYHVDIRVSKNRDTHKLQVGYCLPLS